MSEKELIDNCRNGDHTALQRLYEQYAPKMLGVCYRYVRDHQTAYDLMHDGFITVFSKIDHFRGEGSFEGWLRRIFVNTALMHLRKHGTIQQVTASVDNVRELQSQDASVIEQLSSEELLRCIDQLPPGYGTVLNLYAVEGYSHKEIAEMLGISEGTSRSQYSRAKTQLQELLKESDIMQ